MPREITLDMMRKGNKIQRGKTVRQFAVMVGSTMHVVTSGDIVDHKVHAALVAAGAVAPDELPADGPAAADEP